MIVDNNTGALKSFRNQQLPYVKQSGSDFLDWNQPPWIEKMKVSYGDSELSKIKLSQSQSVTIVEGWAQK